MFGCVYAHRLREERRVNHKPVELGVALVVVDDDIDERREMELGGGVVVVVMTAGTAIFIWESWQ